MPRADSRPTVAGHGRTRAFVVTIDTEANAWDQAEANSVANIRHIGALQEIFDTYGVRPTYLATYEMATRDEAIAVLKPIVDSDRCEIGHHLHVWSCPPFEGPTSNGVETAWLHGLQSELPDELFYAKAETLRAAIAWAYGRPPTSHRAGRWAIDLRTLRWLQKAGFLVDTSMTPGISWAHTRGAQGLYGLDTSRVRGEPFLQDLSEPFEPGRVARDGLLEVPLTAGRLPHRGLGRVAETIMRSGRAGSGLAAKVLPRLFRTPFHVLPCRPKPWFRGKDLIRLAQLAVAETGVVNLMLHSSEVMPGGSPYSRTHAQCARVLSHVRRLSAWAEREELERLTLSELAQRLSNGSDFGMAGPGRLAREQRQG